MNDDLNTPLALSVVYDLITQTNTFISQNTIGKKEAQELLRLWQKMNKILGLLINAETVVIPENIKRLAEDRRSPCPGWAAI